MSSPSHIATLIVAPATPFLDGRHARRAADFLRTGEPPRWLAAGLAVDIPFALPAGDDNRRLAGALRAALAPEPVDVVVQPAAGRRKRLLVADMDATLIEQECVDELAEAVGLRAEVAAITERSVRGLVAFEPALRERVALLRGVTLAEAARIVAARVTLMPGARALVRTMAGQGAATAIVSGGFTVFTASVAAMLGFAAHFANTLVVADGRLTGALEEPILDREAKRRILQDLREAHGLARHETLAVGDGANDAAMLAEAGLGVAFRAQSAVAAAAGARIDHGDLTALLFAQGYRRDEFAM